MAILQIRVDGDPALRRKSRKVEKIDPMVTALIEDMAETMYAAPGIGLAAPQVGINQRIVVVDVGEGIHKMINPKIVEQEGQCTDVEGCLSIPGLVGDVERAEKVVVKAMDPEGKHFKIEAEGLLARCFQHEIDHLDGVLYTDKAISVYEPVYEEEEEAEGEQADETVEHEKEEAPVGAQVREETQAPARKEEEIKLSEAMAVQRPAIFEMGG